MFFTFMEPIGAAACRQRLVGKEFFRIAIVLLHRTQELELTFFFSRRMGGQMASGFLGAEPGELGDDQVQDVLKEAVNMIAGGLVNTCDPEGTMVLGIPELIRSGVPGEELVGEDFSACFDNEGCPFLVCWQERNG
ncbi:MAG: chemotaxis protein CheX [Deltaproteobacteria bacterium]|nr:chemotaxis protein CheX [Candidatus Anaeroferrophillacea bacterium]